MNLWLQLLDAETEAAQYKEEMKQKEKEFEAEMEEHRQAAELMRVSRNRVFGPGVEWKRT